jgi:hypothetical protein
MESLDVENILEIEDIKELLKPHPKLLTAFNDLIAVANNRINAEPPCLSLPLEVNREPDLSDHSSDED